jgi:hypothetical protein
MVGKPFPQQEGQTRQAKTMEPVHLRPPYRVKQCSDRQRVFVCTGKT